MPFVHIVVDRREGVMLLTLNRPEVLNSFNAKMAEDVQRALREAADDAAVRAVLITGSGRAFSSGQDLSEVLPVDGHPSPDLGATVRRQYNPIIHAIRTREKPVICAVNGIAAGAGANLAFACDIVVAASSATFVQSVAKIGVLPD